MTIEHEVSGSYTTSGAEDGYILTGIAASTGGSTISVVNTPLLHHTGFVRFTTFTGTFDDLSRPIDPPNYTSLTLKLVLDDTYGGWGGVLNVYFGHDATWTNAYDVGLDATGVNADSDYLVGTTTIAAATAIGTVVEVDLDLTRIAPYYLKSDWDGKLAFSLDGIMDGDLGSFKFAAAEHATYDPPQLDATWVQFLTGKSGPWWAHSRVDRCGKCGTIDIRERFVEDGYYKGLWVCKDCYDPEEPVPRGLRPDAPPIND